MVTSVVGPVKPLAFRLNSTLYKGFRHLAYRCSEFRHGTALVVPKKVRFFEEVSHELAKRRLLVRLSCDISPI
jgi:hypothetical protein